MHNNNNYRDLEERTFAFAVNILNFLRKMTSSKENDIIKHQLSKSSTSIGANYEEAQGAHSKDDFRYKIGICFRETKESNYWLRILSKTIFRNQKNDKLEYLLRESYELKNIFGSIMKKLHCRRDV